MFSMIASVVSEILPEIRKLSPLSAVQRRSIFGSAATESFSPESIDIDFLVKFFDVDKLGLVDRYLNLVKNLEQILHRPVALVTKKSIHNPYFCEAVEKLKFLFMTPRMCLLLILKGSFERRLNFN